MNKVPCYIRPTTDGRLACQNDAMAFWQSRDPEHRVIHLTDLAQLAKDIRREAAAAAPPACATIALTCEAATTAAAATIIDTHLVKGQRVGAGGAADAARRAEHRELPARAGVLRGSEPARWRPLTPSASEVTDNE